MAEVIENPDYPGHTGNCCEDPDCSACTGSGNYRFVVHQDCRKGCTLKPIKK
jgi:hypothetical protein